MDSARVGCAHPDRSGRTTLAEAACRTIRVDIRPRQGTVVYRQNVATEGGQANVPAFLLFETRRPLMSVIPVAENPSAASTSDALSGRLQLWWRRGTTAALALYLLLMFSGTHAPKIPRALEPRFSDKWQHGLGYLGLGVLVGLWWGARRQISWKTSLLLWGAILAYGAFDEITQPLVGRDADILDWRSDAIGSAVGLALVILALRFLWKPGKVTA